MWHQRSKHKWLVDGDKNTRFYHSKAVQGRRSKIIQCIKNTQGDWVEDVAESKRIFTTFFRNLYITDVDVDEWIQTGHPYP